MAEDRDEQADLDGVAEDVAALNPAAADFKALATKKARLADLHRGFRKQFEEALDRGDLERAGAIRIVNNRIARLRIAIDEMLIEEIDNSADVKAADVIAGINDKLQEAADDAEAAAAHLDELTGTLTELGTLIENIQKLA